jgi:invasion protein IalB
VKPAGPELVAETYGDWVMRCQQVPDGRRCEVVQSVTAQGQAQPIALIALGREKKSDPMRVVVQLPTNVLIESGVNLVLVNGDVLVKAVIRRCAPFGCFADTQIDDGTIGKLKAEKEPASVKFKDAAERDIAFPVSLRGFQPALEALMRI